MSGKNEFYPKVKESFIAAGYEYYDGDEDIKGKTAERQCRIHQGATGHS